MHACNFVEESKGGYNIMQPTNIQTKYTANAGQSNIHHSQCFSAMEASLDACLQPA